MRTIEPAVLITVAYALNEYGVRTPTEASKTVYGFVSSVSSDEISAGGRDGLNPELRFTMTELDYSGQTVFEREGQRYAIYRTYRPGSGMIELYCARRGGTNGTPGND